MHLSSSTEIGAKKRLGKILQRRMVSFPACCGDVSEKDYFFFSTSCTLSEGTISSLNMKAFVLGERTMRITFAKFLPVEVFRVATTFFAIVQVLSTLFDFFVYGNFFQIGVVFLQLQTTGGVLLVLGRDIARHPGNTAGLLLCAFQYNLHSCVLILL